MGKLMPQKERERIFSIDVMRGAAIFGILFVNMLSFHSPILYIDPIQWWSKGPDRFVYMAVDVFFQASFYPLFALLFGYGLALRERAVDKGLNFTAIAARRLLMLFFFGILHVVFIWHGDILICYALFGFIFLLFLRMQAHTLLRQGIIWYTIPGVTLAVILAAASTVAEELPDQYDAKAAQKSISVYADGSFKEITIQRLTDWYAVYNFDSFFFLLLTILPLFMIGAAAAQKKWFNQPRLYRKPMTCILFLALGAGLLLKLLPYAAGRNMVFEYVQDTFGGPLLGISYALMLALLVEKKRIARLLSPLGAVGRLSLSNYLLQSILSSFIFYSYGLGFYGNFSLWKGTILVFGFFGLQLAGSYFWLKKFNYGPVEGLWRSITHLKIPKWKRG